MRRKRNKGFTLIELLIVIAIIGILASIVLVSLSNARERAKDAKVISLANSLSKSMTIDLVGKTFTTIGYDIIGTINYTEDYTTTCQNQFLGNTKVTQACIDMMEAIGKNVTGNDIWELWIGRSQIRSGTSWAPVDEVSIMVRLPSAQGSYPLYCINSAGQSSRVSGSCNYPGVGNSYAYCPGCYRSPL